MAQPILIQAGSTPFSHEKCQVIDFINMDMFLQYVEQAEILILQAGAGSTMQAINAGKYPILIPRKKEFNEVVNDHQIGFAKILHNEGKLTLWNVIRKKFYYASNSGFYLRKYPLKVTDLLFFVIRPAYLRNWKLLFANPLTTIGMFFLKFIEIVAGGLGFLYSKLLSLH